MNTVEADDLAKRIINTWRSGPPLDVWREELHRLDAGTAGTAYAKLRRTAEHAPSIAKFLAEYHALHTVDTPEPDCGDCDRTGWVQAEDRIMPDERRYSQVKPCRCAHGRKAEQSPAWTKRGAA